jgi:hypothetical protein
VDADINGLRGHAEIDRLMLFEIYCAEPWATAQPAALSDQRGSFKYQADLESAQQWQVMCPLIPTSAATVGDEQLTLSTVPVLAFNDAAAPIEQPRHRHCFPAPGYCSSGSSPCSIMKLATTSCSVR